MKQQAFEQLSKTYRCNLALYVKNKETRDMLNTKLSDLMDKKYATKQHQVIYHHYFMDIMNTPVVWNQQKFFAAQCKPIYLTFRECQVDHDMYTNKVAKVLKYGCSFAQFDQVLIVI